MDVNAGFGSAVSKPREPVRVVGGLPYFENVSIVFHGIRPSGGMNYLTADVGSSFHARTWASGIEPFVGMPSRPQRQGDWG